MDNVLAAVNRSNQRGGRMLSVADLIEAGTLSRTLACVLLARLERGASWLVGARPGGAGKTTVMSALLAMLPENEPVHVTRPGTGWEQAGPGECLVAYELSPGHYDGYVWGDSVRRLGARGEAGCRLVSNLHADTLEEARDQVVDQCGATESQFGAFDLFLPIMIRGGARRIDSVHAHERGAWRPLEIPRRLSSREEAIGQFLDTCLERRVYRVEAVRAAWLDAGGAGGPRQAVK